MLLLVSKLYISFSYPSLCVICFTIKTEQNKTKKPLNKLDCQLKTKFWGNLTENPRLNSPHCVSHEAVPPQGVYFVGKSTLIHPASGLNLLTLARKRKGPFLSLSPFVLMRLQVWVNYFVQGHRATESSRSTVHFTYYYAVFYFILPGRALEKRILKGYSN